MTIACLRVEGGLARPAGAVRRAVRRTSACRPGSQVHLYAADGAGTSRLLCEARCVSVLSVCVFSTRMILGGRDLKPFLLDPDRMEITDNDFAREAGFRAFTDLADWLKRIHGAPTHMAPFEGFAIEWQTGADAPGSPMPVWRT